MVVTLLRKYISHNIGKKDRDEKILKLRETKDNSKKVQYPSKVSFIKEEKGIETIRGRRIMKEIK